MRRKNLNKAARINISKIDLSKKYVYFPLHFEPERTTNPDGKEFQDQFIALTKLRQIIPEDIDIVVKEHPTQLRSYLKRVFGVEVPCFIG